MADRKLWVSPFANLGEPEINRRIAPVTRNVTQNKPTLDVIKRDIEKIERKTRGRPKGTVPAMTAAERKRRSRARKKEAQ